MSELVKAGKRLDNILKHVKDEVPKDEWIMSDLYSIFFKAIQTEVSKSEESKAIEKINKIVDTYEFRFGKTFESLHERNLTKHELEVREKIMQDLKKNKSQLVKRYGKDAERVMYGRATTLAKKEIENQGKERIREMIKSILKPEKNEQKRA